MATSQVKSNSSGEDPTVPRDTRCHSTIGRKKSFTLRLMAQSTYSEIKEAGGSKARQKEERKGH